jgi:hypothetical protein
MFEPLVQVRKVDKNCDRLIIIIHKPVDVFVHHGLHTLKHFHNNFFVQLFQSSMSRPGFIIHSGKVFCEFAKIIFFDCSCTISRVGCQKRVPVHYFLTEFFSWIHAKAYLVEKWPETIIFKQIFIIRPVVI